MADKETEIIIRRKKSNSRNHGHHGGSWKIAFADFMTAMMSLFLLLWLVSATTKEQKEGIAMFFNPLAFEETKSASDGMLAGKEIDHEGVDRKSMPNADQDTARAATPDLEPVEKPAADALTPVNVDKSGNPLSDQANQSAAAAHAAEEKSFDNLMDEINHRMSVAIDMEKLAQNVVMEVTPEGLRIQITDRDQTPMFPVGSTGMTTTAATMLQVIGETVKEVPNSVAITGHTDGLSYKDAAGFDNWDLSSGRANSARRILMSAGIDGGRISRVEGMADRMHLIPENPNDARNRRISITILRKN